jgi:hypothetical protein
MGHPFFVLKIESGVIRFRAFPPLRQKEGAKMGHGCFVADTWSPDDETQFNLVNLEMFARSCPGDAVHNLGMVQPIQLH